MVEFSWFNLVIVHSNPTKKEVILALIFKEILADL